MHSVADVVELARRAVPGDGPVVLEPLSGGLLNDSYRADRGGRRHAMRVSRAPPLLAGFAPPRWECRVLKRAAEAGLAPTVECCDPEAGVLVCRWLPGRPWNGADARLPENVARLTALIRRVHALPPPRPAHRVAPADWIARYAELLGPSDAPAGAPPLGLAQPAARRRVQRSLLPAAEPVLCHGDLHPLNLIDGPQGLQILDWEYAHVTEPDWDLAVWSASSDLDPAERTALLTSYLGRPPAPHERERLALLAWLYDYTCLLWAAAQVARRPELGAALPAPRVAALLDRLMAAEAAAVVVAARQFRQTTPLDGDSPRQGLNNGEFNGADDGSGS